MYDALVHRKLRAEALPLKTISEKVELRDLTPERVYRARRFWCVVRLMPNGTLPLPR